MIIFQIMPKRVIRLQEVLITLVYRDGQSRRYAPYLAVY